MYMRLENDASFPVFLERPHERSQVHVDDVELNVVRWDVCHEENRRHNDQEEKDKVSQETQEIHAACFLFYESLKLLC
jgi:hypothetical protein